METASAVASVTAYAGPVDCYSSQHRPVDLSATEGGDASNSEKSRVGAGRPGGSFRPVIDSRDSGPNRFGQLSGPGAPDSFCQNAENPVCGGLGPVEEF